MSRLAPFIAAWLLVASLAQIQPFTKANGQTQAAGNPDVTVSVGPAGIRRHVAGRWATVAVNGMNRSDEDVEQTVTVMIGDDSNLQFARRLWVPAGATRLSYLPVQIPEDLYPDQITIPMKSIQLQEADGTEQFQSNVVGMATSERSLLLSWDESRTAAYFDRREYNLENYYLIEGLGETVFAGRDSVAISVQDLGLVSLGKGFLPPSAKSLDAIDQMVIASDLILDDTVAVQRLRSWIHSGGRVWIMADQVSPESVRAILGDSACYDVVDRVELNDLEIEHVPDYASLESIDNVVWSSETPVEMVRVLVDTDDVQFRVNGWPAAFWRGVGHGEVLFTTLGWRGWLDQDKPHLAYMQVARRFFVPHIAPPKHTPQLVSFLDQEIGYEIPSRGSVAGMLGMHMIVVLLAGAWLARKQQLQYLALVVPLAALLSAGGLIAVGNQKTSAVPSTIASGQIARAIPDTSEVQVESVAAIYSQEARELEIKSTPQTTTSFHEDNRSSEMRRILWDDTGQSRWLFVSQPPGVVRHVVSDSLVNLPQPWMVRAKFSPRGFEGRLSGLNVNSCEDAVIVAMPAPSLALAADPGSPSIFIGGAEHVLSADQYIDDKLMSDVQQARQELLRQLISPETPIFGREPSLLVWTDPIDSGVTFDDNYVRRGSSLAAIPILFERQSSGSRFSVPASFVRIEAYVGERGTSTVFNPVTGKWLDGMNRPNESDLRCVPPRILLPCELSRATVLIKINAPSRTLELKGYVDGRFETLHRRENPNGLLRFEIDQPEALQLDPEGGLLLSIAISATEEELQAASEPDDPDNPKAPSRSTWRIEFVHVNLEGTTL